MKTIQLNTINTYVLNLIIKEFKELIGLYRFQTDKVTVKTLRKAIRNREKIIFDEEDDIEYIKDNINKFKNLKNTYFDRNKYGYRAKSLGTDETIKYLFEDDEEDYNTSEINKQYQSFSNKTLLPLDEYLEKIRTGLINLITKNHKVEPNVNLVFISKNSPSNECNILITLKSADIDEVLDHLIEKHEDLKNINILLKVVESITYSFTKIIVKNAFIESPDWIKNKNCRINLQNKNNKCVQYSIIISLYNKGIKNNPERMCKIKPFINNLNLENIRFPPKEQDYKTFEINNKSIALNVLECIDENRKNNQLL